MCSERKKANFFLFHSYQKTYFMGVGTSENEMKTSTNRATGSVLKFTLMCVSLTRHFLKEYKWTKLQN